MKNEDQKIAWEMYCRNTLHALNPILARHAIILDTEQPHIAGERYLMHAVTTTNGRKLILLGTTTNGTKVIIKATQDPEGKKELEHERYCRAVLARINFADTVFHTPEEIMYLTVHNFVITVTRFIEQEKSFLARTLPEQFELALRAFKGQESAHATTWNHYALISKTFGVRSGTTYLHSFAQFKANIALTIPHDMILHERMVSAYAHLQKNVRTIDQYTGFLTHTDFVPHNIRVSDDTIYLLDHSSLTFGNKYEGWARFLNFMTLYNPALEKALVTYVAENRTSEESTALHLMRLYRLGEIIWYYVRTLEKSAGALHTLNATRVAFWSDVLEHTLKKSELPASLLSSYIQTRDALRSDEEKQRQKNLH